VEKGNKRRSFLSCVLRRCGDCRATSDRLLVVDVATALNPIAASQKRRSDFLPQGAEYRGRADRTFICITVNFTGSTAASRTGMREDIEEQQELRSDSDARIPTGS